MKKSKVALVHDWLNGMRGGEKVLEVLIDIFPECHIYTLLHIPEKVSEKINSRPVFTSPLQRMPFGKKKYRFYLPLMPSFIEKGCR